MNTALKCLLIFTTTWAGSLTLSKGEFVTLLDETFDNQDSLNAWTIYSNNDGRIQLLPDGEAPDDLWVVLDDSVDDVNGSKNVLKRSVTLPPLQELILSFDFMSHDDEVHTYYDGPASIEDSSEFDGIVVRLADGTTGLFGRNSFSPGYNELNLHSKFSLEALSSSPTLTLEFHQFDNFASPNDGLAWNNLKLTGTTRQDILVEAPTTLSESDLTFTMPVLYAPAADSDRLVFLYLRYDDEPHGSAIFPKGATLATLTFPGFDDDLIDGTQSITAYLSDGDSYSSYFTIQVEDDEIAGLALDLPAEVSEYDHSQTATVSVEGPLTNRVWVTLESSHPEILSVPPSVSIASYYSDYSYTFNLSPVSNPRILGNQEVTISASLGGEKIMRTTVFVEGNSLTPVIDGPEQILEGAQGVYLIVGVDALLDEPINVTLSSSLSELVLNTTDVTIEPGASQVAIQVDVMEDLEDLGNRDAVITATAQGGQSMDFTLEIIDNDLSGYSAILPDVLEVGQSQAITVLAVNRDNSKVVNYVGVADILFIDDNKNETVLAEGIELEGGQYVGTIVFPQDATNGSLRIRGRNGLSSDIAPLLFFRKLLYRASDIVYDDTRDKIYGIAGGDAIAGHIRSLTSIDPATGTIGQPLHFTEDPTAMALTYNRQFLYVGIDGSSRIERVALDSFSVEGRINLRIENNSSTEGITALDILTLPGRPLDVVVSQRRGSYYDERVSAYINGVLMPESIYSDHWALAPGSTPGTFYGLNISSSSFDLNRARVTTEGIERSDRVNGLLGRSVKVVADRDIVYSTDGSVIDGLSLKALGKINLPWDFDYYSRGATDVLLDLDKSRVFYVYQNELAVFDSTSSILLERLVFPAIGNFENIISYGETGLAATTDQGYVVLIESSRLRATGDPTDLEVTLSRDSELAVIDQPVTYTYQVTNKSSVVAKRVTLSIDLGLGQELESTTHPNFQVNGGLIRNMIGDLAPGASVSVTTSAIPSRLTTLVTTAAATTASLDANYENNAATSVLNVSFKSGKNSVNVLDLKVTDIVVNEVTGNLLVLTSDEASPAISNSILVMSPITGQILKTIALPDTGHMLALAENGLVAFALNGSQDTIYEVNLGSNLLTKIISLDGKQAVDIKVQRGTSNTLIVSLGNWDGIAIYKNGLLQPGALSTYYNQDIVLLPDPSLIFTQQGRDGFKYRIRSSGITELARGSNLLSYSAGLKGDGYFIFDSSGGVARADTLTSGGTYDLSALPGASYSDPVVVEPDLDRQRVYYSRAKTIVSFNSNSRLKIRSKSFSDLPTSIVSLERWASDGFVAQLKDNSLAIIRTDLVPTEASSIDLIVRLENGMTVTDPALTFYGEAYAGQGVSSVTVNNIELPAHYDFTSWTATLELVDGDNVISINASEAGTNQSITKVFVVRYLNPQLDEDLESLAMEKLGMTELPEGWAALDDDSDGFGTRFEILFGMDPMTPDDMPGVLESWQGGEELMCYRRLRAHAGRYCVAVSRSLGGWDQSESLVTLVGDPVVVAEDNRYEDVCFKVSAGSETRMFLQVMVE